MKNEKNLHAAASFRGIFEDGNILNISNPALKRMQVLSSQAAMHNPTAITKLEVYKECHVLADDLYRLTGNKKMMTQVLRVGDLLLSRIFGNQDRSLHANQ
jgi:hypothetical protein